MLAVGWDLCLGCWLEYFILYGNWVPRRAAYPHAPHRKRERERDKKRDQSDGKLLQQKKQQVQCSEVGIISCVQETEQRAVRLNEGHSGTR